jgi:hypothetical protein
MRPTDRPTLEAATRTLADLWARFVTTGVCPDTTRPLAGETIPYPGDPLRRFVLTYSGIWAVRLETPEARGMRVNVMLDGHPGFGCRLPKEPALEEEIRREVSALIRARYGRVPGEPR